MRWKMTAMAAAAVITMLATPAASAGEGEYHSTTWSGYAAAGTTFRYVAATWTVAAVNCTGVNYSFTTHWAGLDGLTSGTVEQAGSDTECDHQQAYYATFWEMYPASYVPRFYVKPGDVITASVYYSAGQYRLRLYDATSRRGFTVYRACAAGCERSSAEVISESYQGTGSPARQRFRAIHVTDAKIERGTFYGPWTEAAVVKDDGGIGPVEEQPGPLNSTGNAFTNIFVAP